MIYVFILFANHYSAWFVWTFQTYIYIFLSQASNASESREETIYMCVLPHSVTFNFACFTLSLSIYIIDISNDINYYSYFYPVGFSPASQGLARYSASFLPSFFPSSLPRLLRQIHASRWLPASSLRARQLSVTCRAWTVWELLGSLLVCGPEHYAR